MTCNLAFVYDLLMNSLEIIAAFRRRNKRRSSFQVDVLLLSYQRKYDYVDVCVCLEKGSV